MPVFGTGEETREPLLLFYGDMLHQPGNLTQEQVDLSTLLLLLALQLGHSKLECFLLCTHVVNQPGVATGHRLWAMLLRSTCEDSEPTSNSRRDDC